MTAFLLTTRPFLDPMASKSDPRRNVGAAVHAKAEYITSFKECSRLFGSLAKSTFVPGTVLEVLTTSVNGRSRTSLKVKWLLNEKEIVKTLNVRSIRPGRPPSSALTRRNPNRDAPLPVQAITSGQDTEHRPTGQPAYSEPVPEYAAIPANPEGPFDFHGAEWVNEDVVQPIGVLHRSSLGL